MFLIFVKNNNYKKQMNFLEFRKNMLPFKVFSTKDIAKRFPDFDSRRLFEWQEKGYIQKLINKWYLLTETEKSEYLYFRISNSIVKPSYVSMETALSWYNLIPESVFSIQTITTRKSQHYETVAGNYNCRSVKPSAFFGYTVLRESDLPILLAEKEKAILDYLYLTTGIRSKEDIAALRLNIEETKDIDWQKFDHYAGALNSKSLNRRIEFFKSIIADDVAE